MRCASDLLSCFFAALVAVGLLACATGRPPVPVAPGPFEPLAVDEGFLVVQVDTDLGVEWMRFDRRLIVGDLQPGRHLWLIRMKSGTYAWRALRLIPQSRGTETIRPEAAGVLNRKEFEFSVEAGAINYPGEVVIRKVDSYDGLAAGVSVRNRNHSAMAIRSLMKTHAALVAGHPLRYAGASGDEFLQFYTRERARVVGSAGAPQPAREGK